MRQISIGTLVFGAVLACFPATAMAVTLAPGGSVLLPGTTAAAEPELAGTVVNDDVQQQLAKIGGEDSLLAIGTSLQNRVVRSDLDGTLIFAPRLLTTFNNTGSDFLVDRFELTGFGDFAVDANYRTDGLGDRGPNAASRSGDGDVMTFDFLFPLFGGNLVQEPQESSYFLSLNTEATAFSLDGRASIFARHLGSPGETFRFDFANIAVPVIAPVPLPASWLLLLGALGITRLASRRTT